MRRIVVMGADQKHYLGEVDWACEPSLMKGKMVELLNVYEFISVDSPVVSQRGEVTGLKRGYMLMTIGTSDGALPVLNIAPQGWYDLEICKVSENIQGLVEQASKTIKKVDERSNLLKAGADTLTVLDGAIGAGLHDLLRKK